MTTIYQLKKNITDVLRDYLYPEQTLFPERIDWTDGKDRTYAQSFKVFSTKINKVGIYIRKTGTPDGDVILEIRTDSNGNPSDTILGSVTIKETEIGLSFAWIEKDINLTNLDSRDTYWLVIRTTASTSLIAYYMLGRDETDTNYELGTAKDLYLGIWSSLGYDLTFKITILHWIYSDYPHEELDFSMFPRVAIDIVSKDVVERYVDGKKLVNISRVRVLVYSLYTDEVDNIMSNIEKALFTKRFDIPDILYLTPSSVSEIGWYRNKLYTREALYDCKWFETM